MTEPAEVHVDEVGDPIARRVLGALDGLEDRPVTEHVEVLEEVNRTIAAELAALDEV
ncbi:MAG: hypothetical protein ACNA8R_03885 [Nitriliruptoraceae bacterium]